MLRNRFIAEEASQQQIELLDGTWATAATLAAIVAGGALWLGMTIWMVREILDGWTP